MNIAFLGECMIELSRSAHGFEQKFGGDTLNTALYLSRLNHAQAPFNVQYFTALGTDPYSETMLAAWQQEGIGTDFIYQDLTRLPGLYIIDTAADGERSFHFWRSDSAARAMFEQPDADLWLANLIANDVIFLSGVTLGILTEAHRETLIRYLRIAKSEGKKIVFDNNFRSALWASPSVAREAFDQILAVSDIALLSFEDDQAVFGSESLEACFQRVQTQSPQEVIIKNGGEDCWYSNAERLPQVFPLAKINTVKDTTAAGDSFNAGYLFSRLRGESVSQSIQVGHALACEVIQHEGAIMPFGVMPTAEQLLNPHIG